MIGIPDALGALPSITAPTVGSPVLEIVLIVVTALTVTVGLFISYQAFRGLQRNGSRRMLYLSTGMLLLFGVAYALGTFVSIVLQFGLIALVWQDVLRLLVRIVQLSGLLCIAYSMYVE